MRSSLILLCVFFSSVLFAQEKAILSGVIRDAYTSETLIGANVTYAPGKGAVTDIDGKYEFELDYGTYEITISYVGYETATVEVVVDKKKVYLDYKLKTKTLEAVLVVADVATTRETPVAFTNILPAQLEEELASQDLPMILNKTPGVYATNSGGGDGDARINIRGFNQRNLAVMLDGIPVNDMENGWVYWSNWFGLDMVTRTLQVQRGLGASKLAIPSVGGTMNIITKSVGTKPSYSFKQEMANDGYFRSSIGITTPLKNDWGLTFAGSYKQGEGYVDQTWTKGWFYFLRLDKKMGKHLLSISAMGAPQEHGQRPYTSAIATYNLDDAAELGIDTATQVDYRYPTDKGIRYNDSWGYLNRWEIGEAGDTIREGREALNTRINQYHKPMFTIRDYWNVSDKLYISNIAYLSIGTGGGTALFKTPSYLQRDDNGQYDLQLFYDVNKNSTTGQASNYIRKMYNSHFWYGFLSNFTYKHNDDIEYSGGIDLRDYKGIHYTEVYDLLGAQYTRNDGDKNRDSKEDLEEGAKVNYYYDGLVRWGGAYGQVKYNGGNFTAFLNLSAAYSGYQRVDYFAKKEITVGDTVLQVGYADTVNYNGDVYTRDSEGLEHKNSGWKWLPGFTVKGGVNYNLNESMNVFCNLGFLSRTPRFNNVIDQNNSFFKEIENENVKAIELGYSYFNKKITANLNAYYTIWDNKPTDQSIRIPDPESDNDFSANINGMNALHKGIEFEFGYKPTHSLLLETVVSLGDWKYTSSDSVRFYDENLNLVDVWFFDASGVHVGDAAQVQLMQSFRYEFIKNAYISSNVVYFTKNYADFDPISLSPNASQFDPDFYLDEDGNPRDSWKMPAYYLIDLHAGYSLYLKSYKLDFRFSILNLMDKIYIADARNNDSYKVMPFSDFDAKSATVHYGLGRRWNFSVKISI